MDFIITIALLCGFPGDAVRSNIQKCREYYINCMEQSRDQGKSEWSKRRRLEECIKEKR